MFIYKEWVKNIVVYPYKGILLSNKKKQMIDTYNMNEFRIVTHSERSQIPLHTHKSIYLMILLYNSLENENRPIVTESRSMVFLGQSENGWWQKCWRKLLGRWMYSLSCLWWYFHKCTHISKLIMLNILNTYSLLHYWVNGKIWVASVLALHLR